MKSLEELHLYQNGIGIHGIDGIKCLVNAIASNPNLRVLNLSDNTLTADGGTELARSLSHLPYLEELILDDCLIRARGCRSLASELEREDVVPDLKCLRLYGNEITRDAGVHLAICLVAKTKLKHLNLNANEFGSTGIDMVIRTLESIGLIEALDVPPGDPSAEDGVSDDLDPRHRAFDEDQGSDNEDEEEDDDEEEDFEAGEYSGSEEEEDFEDEEGTPTQSSFHSGGKSGDSSFQTVKERPVGGPFGYVSAKSSEKQTGTYPQTGGGVFSFRSILSDIQNEANANHGTGLFSALDSTDASACRSKLWANATAGTKGSPFSGLFAPPRLGTVVTPPKETTPANPPSGGLFSSSVATQPATVASNFKEAEALDCFKQCLASPEDDTLMRILAGKLPCWSKWNISEATLVEVSPAPETLVRFAFRFARQHGSNPNQMDLAIRALLSACTADSHPAAAKKKQGQLISLSGRAVNQILVHLGAMKPDRSDPTEIKASEEVLVYAKTDLELLNRLLSQHGSRLNNAVRQSLALLLSQHKEDHPQAPPIASALDAVLGALEDKLGSLSMS
ncbi:Ran GTPase-activating protein 1 [Sparganum proliferum]